MKRIPLKILLKNSVTYYAVLLFMGLLLVGCASTKKMPQQTILLDADQPTAHPQRNKVAMATPLHDFGYDNHEYISLKPAQLIPPIYNTKDSLAQTDTTSVASEVTSPVNLETNSPVAAKLVENYLNSDNKEPNGHCLAVSKGRFEQAYKQVHGHSLYRDLPDSMATKLFTPKQVFDLLYASASETEQGWQSLPEKYRGKGNAGAIAYAGMGTLVDSTAIWSGKLRPGALVQVWRFKVDYEQVVHGVDVKKLDPYGHSFIFISYVRDEENVIIGLKIADQGFQSYRPLRPSDYEVWWAVNLSI
ncbi:MAG: hypothetical protein WBM83_10325 [Flavobacteriaceae bacterium]